MPNIRVYLVEDQALIRESLRAMLQLEADIEVVGEAAEAELALQTLETLDVDLVLMDIGLPKMDGIEATRVLKGKRHDLPVVMLTSNQDEYLTKALAAGASGFILKSCTRQQLVDAIKVAFQGQVPIDPSLTGRLVRDIAELQQVRRESLLTPRQVEILKMVAEGTRYAEVATKLFVSETTVNREMRNIFNRLGVNDAAHAVSEAYKGGLI